MRLLITLDFPPECGGIQRHLSGIVMHTFTRDDAVFVGCGNVPPSEAQGYPCAVTYVSTLFSRVNKKWSLVPLLLKCLRARRSLGEALAVECGNVYAGLAPWLISLIMPAVRYSVYAYGSELIGLKKATFAGMVLKNVLSRADRIIAISSYTASLVRSICPAVKIEIIFPKIDHVPAELTLPNNAATAILSVGRLVRHKGHAILLDAVSRLPNDMRWSLVIAGNGPLLDSLAKQCRRLGISGRVEFKTALPDKELEREYRTASLFVLPSIAMHGAEGFGIVLLEAMAHGLPIVASNTGGITEVLDNGSCGVLVPPGDPAVLCDSIMNIARDKALRERLASAALERLRKRYVW
jgi:glycosyltransferase involved in cell wall biosynthesis